MRCPYCKSINFIKSQAEFNAEHYAPQGYNVCCTKCGGAVRVYFSKKVWVSQVSPTTFECDDWGEKPKKQEAK